MVMWSSTHFGNARYSIANVYPTLDAYIRTAHTDGKSSSFDYILVSATSLQELSSLFAKLSPLIRSQLETTENIPTIVLESTNFVNLEPFVSMSLQLDKSVTLPILSVMSDFDIRLVGENSYSVRKSLKESELLYVGRSGTDSEYTSNDIEMINQFSDLLESAGLDVYKLKTPVEFFSYQWKFALPRIALGPLSILFEKPFPMQLQDHILAKPLISGLILEVITIIKTIGCKLFKSYDSENSLLQRLGELEPVEEVGLDFLETPQLYYNFYHQNELYMDLLLLQPILIADDYQVKTPYLEFLYAMMCQVNNNNRSTLSNPTSDFWLRKTDEHVKQLKQEEEELIKRKTLQEKQIKEQKEILQHMKASQTNGQIHQAQQSEQLKQHHQSVSTPLSQDGELEELSQLAQTYLLNEKTPSALNGNEFSPQTMKMNQTDHSKNSQGSDSIDPRQTESPSPTLTQNLPHGLPPQGLPAHQQIFSQQLRQSNYQQTYQQPYPPSQQYQQPSQQYQQLPQQYQQPYQQKYQQPYPTSQQPYPQQYNQYLPPQHPHTVRRQRSMPFDNSSMMQSGMPRTFSVQPNEPSMPLARGPGPSNFQQPSGLGRQFKKTSRKSSRKSNAFLTNSLLSTSDGLEADSRGMPGARLSMMPLQNTSSNVVQQHPVRRSSSGFMLPRKPSSGFGIEVIPQQQPQSQSQSQSQSHLQSASQTHLQAQGQASQPAQAPSSSSSSSQMRPPPAIPQQRTDSGSRQSSPYSASESPLASGSSSKEGLAPVPEATPAPTPAYVVSEHAKNQDKKKKKKKKKKKGGLFGLGRH
ncbi:hypothetical protein FOA43_001241 [Brettanomyces nanus]|uniref:Ketopantoate reductase C-terminal domain-containing protein n=1 Tax=Eeniella nana TaxID=13502 RepID=A0A875RXV6_EENNA|nr:uncharacterized protein FOA43_001241 [Brettanomyces nanus]QPG73926.1 hypothetical protein FOA43_001241 [Brettanomyces nanus]